MTKKGNETKLIPMSHLVTVVHTPALPTKRDYKDVERKFAIALGNKD